VIVVALAELDRPPGRGRWPVRVPADVADLDNRDRAGRAAPRLGNEPKSNRAEWCRSPSITIIREPRPVVRECRMGQLHATGLAWLHDCRHGPTQ
jgi:hypothetical protein